MEGSNVWWPLDGFEIGGPWKVLMFGGPWKVPMLGGLWMVPSLVALGKFQCLVVFGRRRRNIIFTSSPSPFNKFYLNLLSLTYYNHASWCTKSSTHSLANWFRIKIFFLFKFMVLCMTMFYRPQATQVNEELP